MIKSHARQSFFYPAVRHQNLFHFTYRASVYTLVSHRAKPVLQAFIGSEITSDFSFH